MPVWDRSVCTGKPTHSMEMREYISNQQKRITSWEIIIAIALVKILFVHHQFEQHILDRIHDTAQRLITWDQEVAPLVCKIRGAVRMQKGDKIHWLLKNLWYLLILKSISWCSRDLPANYGSGRKSGETSRRACIQERGPSAPPRWLCRSARSLLSSNQPRRATRSGMGAANMWSPKRKWEKESMHIINLFIKTKSAIGRGLNMNKYTFIYMYTRMHRYIFMHTYSHI